MDLKKEILHLLEADAIKDPDVTGIARPKHFGGETYTPAKVAIPGDDGTNVETELGRLSYRTIERVMYRSMLTKTSMIVFGMPGVGKSEILRSFAQHVQKKNFETREFVYFNTIRSVDARKEVLTNPEKYYFVLDIRTSMLTIDQIKGTPKVGTEKKFAWEEYTKPPWVYLATHPSAAGVLLLDEINQGSTSVLNMMFQVLLDRVIDSDPISDDVFICGAGNIGAQFTVNDIPVPVLTRGKIGWLEANPQEWYSWAESINPKTQHPFVDPVIVAYVKSDPAKTFLVVPGQGEGGSRQAAFPCPRSITVFSRQFVEINNQYNNIVKADRPWVEEVFDEAAHACGHTWAAGFVKFLKSTERNWLNMDHLEKTNFDSLDKAANDAIKQYLYNKIRFLSDAAITKQDSSKEIELSRALRVMAKLDIERLTSLLTKLKDDDTEMFGRLGIKLAALKSTDVNTALQRVQGITQKF